MAYQLCQPIRLTEIFAQIEIKPRGNYGQKTATGNNSSGLYSFAIFNITNRFWKGYL